jgi:hypothetical protein
MCRCRSCLQVCCLIIFNEQHPSIKCNEIKSKISLHPQQMVHSINNNNPKISLLLCFIDDITHGKKKILRNRKDFYNFIYMI